MRTVLLAPLFLDSPCKQHNKQLIRLLRMNRGILRQSFCHPPSRRRESCSRAGIGCRGMIVEGSRRGRALLVSLAEPDLFQVLCDFGDDILGDKLDRIQVADLAVEFVRSVPDVIPADRIKNKPCDEQPQTNLLVRYNAYLRDEVESTPFTVRSLSPYSTRSLKTKSRKCCSVVVTFLFIIIGRLSLDFTAFDFVSKPWKRNKIKPAPDLRREVGRVPELFPGRSSD